MANKKYLFVLMSFLLISSISQGHSPTEIGFKFTEENQQTYVQVHLTTITLFDLLYDLNPELQSRESLNLSSFIADYEDYFNRNLDLKLNGRAQKLEYFDANLIIHDATITFLIRDFKETITDYSVSIGGFEFYSKPRFTLLFTTSLIADICFLSREDNTCSGGVAVSQTEVESSSYLPHGVLIVVVGIMLALLGAKRMRFYTS